MSWLDRWREWRTSHAEDQAMLDEAAFHVEQETERNIRSGMAPGAARRAAALAFGSVDRYREQARAERSGSWLDDFAQDVRFAARMLRRSPVFALVAVSSLALGIGANTAVFSIVNGVLLRPLDYPAPDRLQMLYVRPDAEPELQGGFSVADLEGVASETRALAAIGAYSPAQGGLALSMNGQPEQIVGTWVTSGVFRALGVSPLLGRGMQSADDQPGAPRSVVLSHAFWRDRLGADARVIGRALELDAEAYTIVGVMPRGFMLPGLPEDRVWPALHLEPAAWRAPFWLRVVARAAPGSNGAALGAELDRARVRVQQKYPGSPPQWRYAAEPLKSALVADARATVLLLLGAVALVLLIATANVANLLLARLSARAPELALRTSLGAARGRLVRQLLTESLMISCAGGVLGLLLAYSAVRLAVANWLGALPRVDDIRVDGTVLLATIALAIFVGMIIGLVPALRLSRSDLAWRLREGARSVVGRGQARLRHALVVVEFALALVVLIGAGLLVQTLLRVQRVDTGVRAENVLSVRISAPEARYPTEAQIDGFYDAFAERVARIPGVRAVGISMGLPPARLVMRNPFTPQDKVFATTESAPVAEELLISSQYFDALGIQLLAGRAFTAADRDSMPPVAIVNETLAKRYLGGNERALGRWIQTGDPDPESPRLEIVGIVRDVRYGGLREAMSPTIYVPFKQNLWWRTMYVTLRTPGDAAALLPLVRAELAAVDPNAPIMESLTLAQLNRDAAGEPRFRAALFSAFGVLALLLATSGIYGVMSYTVTQRRREIAVRIALGARSADILRRTVMDGLRLAAMGIAFGLIASLLIARSASRLLDDVAAIDLRVFALMALMLAAVGLCASAIPAARAARVPPAVALLSE